MRKGYTLKMKRKSVGVRPPKSGGRKVLRKIKRYRFIYLMLLPVVIYFLIFSYYPLALGLYNSFHNVKLLGGSQFVGFENYVNVVKNPQYSQAFLNSVIVGVGSFLLQFVWGLVIALLLNEVKRKVTKSAVQTVTYIPNLLSWSVVGGLWIAMFAPAGLINGFLELFRGEGQKAVVFMSEPSFARGIMIFTGAWKGAGYYAALFLAAIVAIDPTIYEAAAIDGASRMKQIKMITLPGIVPTMKVITVLAAMGVLRNFDQIFIMQNSNILDKIRNLLYLIYTEGIIKFKIGPATAAATIVLLATAVISFFVRRLTHYDDSYEE